MSEYIVEVSDDSFATDVLQASIPVLVDFWAEWCGPCKMIAPVLEDVAKDYVGKIKITKLNVDHNNQTPAIYDVRGIPTLIIFKNGQTVATKVGAMTKSQLVSFIDSVL